MQIQSVHLETGYICKNCNNYLCGCYVFLKGEMYFRGECKCSFWLVKSTQLNHLFNFNRT